MSSEHVLRVEDIDAGYGRVPVVRGVSVHVGVGEMVTLIGANGAGKSTLLKVVAGLIKPTAGRVVLKGRDIAGLAPEKLVRNGLALVPEGRMLFGPMSVQENLLLGAHSRPGRDPRIAVDMERVQQLFPVLAERADQPAETLSGGEQQMLAIGRALMSSPRLLLLDEPSLGLAPRVISAIFGVLDALRSDGLAMLLVEQDAKIALKHADRGYVMRTGRIALTGGARELLDDDEVRRIYLGASGESRG
ncbi:MAG: ABC transporter ATP-binding protein [Coriobacteriia bacterium]